MWFKIQYASDWNDAILTVPSKSMLYLPHTTTHHLLYKQPWPSKNCDMFATANVHIFLLPWYYSVPRKRCTSATLVKQKLWYFVGKHYDMFVCSLGVYLPTYMILSGSAVTVDRSLHGGHYKHRYYLCYKNTSTTQIIPGGGTPYLKWQGCASSMFKVGVIGYI